MSFFYEGTKRSNKLEIPAEFLKDNKRTVGSSIFAFKNYLTLVSFVPKKNKAVILVSSKHHEAAINETKGKPENICDYNRFKGIFLKNSISINEFSLNPKAVLILLTS